MGAVLTVLLDSMHRSMKGLGIVARENAESLGLEYLGSHVRPEGTPVLRFPLDDKLHIRWAEVDAQLASVGLPTALYTIPSEMLFGIRGEKGDICVRLVDVQQHRLDGVLDWIKEQRT